MGRAYQGDENEEGAVTQHGVEPSVYRKESYAAPMYGVVLVAVSRTAIGGIYDRIGTS